MWHGIGSRFRVPSAATVSLARAKECSPWRASPMSPRLAGVSKSTASRALTGSRLRLRRDARSACARPRPTASATSPSTSAVSLATGRTRHDRRGHAVPQPVVLRRGARGHPGRRCWSAGSTSRSTTRSPARPVAPASSRTSSPASGSTASSPWVSSPTTTRSSDSCHLAAPSSASSARPTRRRVVAIDDDYAARRATEHLIALGHRRIAFVGGSAGRHWAQRRSTPAARDTAQRWRMPGSPSSCRAHPLRGDAARRVRGRRRRARRRARPADRASSPSCDEVAIGAIIAARRLGVRVPSDLSVIGIDDHEFAEMFSLTTLQQVPREQGRVAVDLLLAQLDDPDAPAGDRRA